MRAGTLGLSIAGHVGLGLVFALLATHERAPSSTTATTIELVDVPPPPPPPPAPAKLAPAEGSPAPSARARMRVPARTRSRTLREQIGEVGIDAGVVGDGDIGQGGAVGGSGRGFGLGDGARIASEVVALETPPAPAASKARIAKLVYPVREREVDDAELFVARVTIDHEGYVIGAKLVRGFGGPRDAQAADLIWKFRYAPALDDQGRAVRSTFEQRFLVGR